MTRRRIYDHGDTGRQKKNGTAAVVGTPARRVRCAIYTRKSTSEGLDQAFNSLDAQREACEAYVASQKAHGWSTIPTRYDDGGFTGGNIERPAVQQLLDDILHGRVDCVVVYKVDRLSRSLLDFARIIRLFEEHDVHFVSVTQHFNTADSMGRLTLNILLSFAQFEREIIAERTRDKIAAARRRGQWSGGRPILGYDAVPGEQRLVVHPAEAQQVREIFRLYLQKESVLSAARELNARGWTTKRWVASTGAVIGGRPFDRPNLHHLLTNVAYIGRVRYRDETHPGQHEAIVEAALWERVQRLLQRNRRTAGSFLRNRYGALLKGILRCGACDAAMVQMVSRKGPRLHRYYVCTKAQKCGYDQCPTGTILARALEQEVCRQLKKLALNTNGRDGDQQACSTSMAPDAGPQACSTLMAADVGTWPRPTSKALDGHRAYSASVALDGANGVEVHEQSNGKLVACWEEVPAFFSADWDDLPPPEQARLIRFVVQTCSYNGATQRAMVTLTDEATAWLADADHGAPTDSSESSGDPCTKGNGGRGGKDGGGVEFTVTGLKPRKHRRPVSTKARPLPEAVRTLVLAFQIEQAVRDGRARDYAEVAGQIGMTRARVSQILGLLRLPTELIEMLLLADPARCPRLTERQLRPMIAGTASSAQLDELRQVLSQAQPVPAT